MTRKVKLPLYGNPSKVAEVDVDATEGAVVGVNLRRKDGTIVTEEDLGGQALAAAQAFSTEVLARATSDARRQLEALRGDIDEAIASGNAEVARIRLELLGSINSLETTLEGIEDEIFRVDSNDPGVLQSISGLKFDMYDQAGYIAEQVRLTYEPDPLRPPAIFGQRLLAMRASIEGVSGALIASESVIRAQQDLALARRADMLDAVLNLIPAAPNQPPSAARSQALEAIELRTTIGNTGLPTAVGQRLFALEAALTGGAYTGLGSPAAGSLDQIRVTVNDSERGVTATASRLDSVQATANGASANVSSLSQVVVGPATVGNPTPLLARHALRVETNAQGRRLVTGMVFDNNGSTTAVDFLANAFRISIGNNPEDAVAPFVVQADPENGNAPTVFMTNAKIDSARINNLTVNRINGGSVASLWNFDNPNGLMRFVAGGLQRIMGAGFGVGNKFVDWVGPAAVPIGSVDTNTAGVVSYITTSGDFFIAGGIAVGSITNSRQTNSIAPNASVSIDHASLGRQVTVTVSYECQVSGTRTTDQGTPPLPSGSLLVSLNGLNYTLTANGATFSDFDPGGGGYIYSVSLAASATYTIPAGPPGNRPVSASVASRSIAPVGGNAISLDSFTQNITIITSEG